MELAFRTRDAIIIREEFKPLRGDIVFVGRCGEHLDEILEEHTRVREVYVDLGTVDHYRKRHEGQFDIDLAESLLSIALADPEMVCQDRKPSSLVFVAGFDEDHFLIVPIKVRTTELWLESVFIDNKRKFLKRGWVRTGILYQKNK